MGLSWWSPDGTYCGQDTVAEPSEVVSAEMLRRHLIALGAITAVGGPAVGELTELPGPVPLPLPSRIFEVHVMQVRDLTWHLREAVRAYGSAPVVTSVATSWATRLLGIPGAERVKRELMAAVAELHAVAGWAAFNAGLYDHSMRHYGIALKLATKAGDSYLQALALGYAGLATVAHGHPDDGLKMLQFGQVKTWDLAPGDDRRRTVEAQARIHSVTALARLGHPEAADVELTEVRELWRPDNPYGDPDRVAALLNLGRRRLDAAEPFAAASVHRWDGISRLAHTQSSIVLATIHVRAGEPGGLRLAHNAITAVTTLSSARARRRLELNFESYRKPLNGPPHVVSAMPSPTCFDVVTKAILSNRSAIPDRGPGTT